MNDLQRLHKFLKIKEVLEGSAPVKIFGKVREIPVKILNYCDTYTFSLGWCKEKNGKEYTTSPAKALEGKGYILPRRERFHNIYILDANSKYITLEL